MNVSIDTSEIDTLARDFIVGTAVVAVKAAAAVGDVADKTEAIARSLAPVLTGALRNSIGVEGSGLERTVSAKADHAFFVEYGTSDTAPQPFMFPAADRAEPRLVDELGKVADPFI